MAVYILIYISQGYSSLETKAQTSSTCKVEGHNKQCRYDVQNISLAIGGSVLVTLFTQLGDFQPSFVLTLLEKQLEGTQKQL